MPKKFAQRCVLYMLTQYRDESADFDFILALEQRTDMVFISEPSNTESLCYANSQAVRTEYKTSFTTADLWNYTNNLPSPQNTDLNTHLKSILPKTKQQFWDGVHQKKLTPNQSQS